MASDILANNGSDNGFLSNSTKPLPEPIYWSIISKVTWHSSEGIVINISEDTLNKLNIA